MKFVKLTKLRDSDKPLFPKHIAEGTVKEGPFVNYPVIGEPFDVGEFWSTSVVQEVIDEKTFRTYNSIYQYEVYEK